MLQLLKYFGIGLLAVALYMGYRFYMVSDDDEKQITILDNIMSKMEIVVVGYGLVALATGLF